MPSTSIAEELAKKQREISVSEFFERNKQILGYDSTTKALLTVVKEAWENSADACEEAEILPEILVEVAKLDRFRNADMAGGHSPKRTRRAEHQLGPHEYGARSPWES